MELAEQMWERRFAEDRSIVDHGLLTIHNRCVRFIQVVGNLVNEVVLFGDRDRSSTGDSIRLLVSLVQSASYHRASQSEQTN